MDEKMKARCVAIFKSAKRLSSVYVAGDKIFDNVGAALSYSSKVEEVKREEALTPAGNKAKEE